MRKINQRAVGSIIGYICVLANVFVGLLTVTYLTKFLGQAEYGVYSLVASLVGYMSIMDFGMHSVIVRYISVYKAKNDELSQKKFLGITLKIYLVIDFIVIIIGGLIYNNIPFIFQQSLTSTEINLTQKLFVVLLLNLLISLPGAVFEAICVAYEKFVLIKSLQLVKLILKFLLLLIILNLGGKSYQLVWLDTILNIIVLFVEALYVLMYLKIEIDIRAKDKKLLSSIFRFTYFIFIASISDQVNWKVDSLILGIIKGSEAVAISAVGMQIVSVYRNIVAVIPGVYLPKVTTMTVESDNSQGLTDLMINIGRIQFYIVGVIICVFIAAGKSFINIWVGDGYSEAFWVFIILAIALIIPNTQSIGINILEAKNMHGFRAKVYLVISIINILVTIGLVGIYGVVGAAIATAIALIIGNVFIINWYYYKKVKLEMKRFYKSVYGKGMPALIISGVVSYMVSNYTNLKLNEIHLLIYQVLASLSIYVIIMFLVKYPQEILRFIKGEI